MAQTAHSRRPVGQDRKRPEDPRFPSPPTQTHHQPAAVGAAHGVQSTLHTDLSHLFRVWERRFLSSPTSFFRVPIDIDVPHNPQAAGGPYTPPRNIILPSRNINPPPPPPSPPPPTPWSISIPSPSQRHSLGKHLTHPPSRPLTPMTHYHRPQTTSINPLPVVPGPTNNHYIPECQARRRFSQYPYPPTDLSHKPPTNSIINGNTRRNHTPSLDSE